MVESQNSITKLFIKKSKELIDKGEIASYADLNKKLDWNKTSMSSIINGRRNVPTKVYKKFLEIYAIKTDISSNNTFAQLTEKLISIESNSRVLLMALAELLAEQRQESFAKVLSELDSAVNQQIKSYKLIMQDLK